MLGIYARTSKENPNEPVSTIEQQIQKGIEFAVSHNVEYIIYPDKGISGYKINEDEDNDPFNNRPEFTKLINDIKSGKIDSVWVWEHSRLSRNQYASAFIFNIFSKYKIKLYENDKEFNLSDPTTQMMRQVLDAVAQYERSLIVGRTTRGFYNAIDNGKRAFAKFYGYKRTGRDKTGHLTWEPVESEIKTLQYCYDRYKKGDTLRSIARALYENESDEANQEVLMRRSTKLGRFLRHSEYTGYSLTTKGLEILHKYENYEIDSLSALSNLEYWVKSAAYPVQIITISEWIQIRERLQVAKKFRKNALQRKIKAGKSLATGIIQCSVCKSYYYFYAVHYQTKKVNWKSDYQYYYHQKIMNNEMCSNKPKSFQVEKIDTIFDIFMFYFVLIFDSSKKVIEDSLAQQDIERKKVMETIKSYEEERKHCQKQIEKFNKAIEITEDVQTIAVLAGHITKVEKDIGDLAQKIAAEKINVEKINAEYERTELQKTYFSLKEKIMNYFEKYNTEMKREELLKVLNACFSYGRYILISANKTIFIFDTKENYPFPTELYEKLKNDEVFYNYITGIENSKPGEKFEALAYQDSLINNFELDKNITIIDFLKDVGITYDFQAIKNIVLLSANLKKKYIKYTLTNSVSIAKSYLS